MIESTPIVLASSSPRRREILDRLGLRHEVMPPQVAEHWKENEKPSDFALRIARDKAETVAKAVADRTPPPLIIAADTVVVIDGQPLGKPANDEEARRMLASASGRDHLVLTGWIVLPTDGSCERSGVETTRVWFKELRSSEIEGYVATGEGKDKAGSYGVQGLGCFLVEKIEGSYENVVGLPACPLVEALQQMNALAGYPSRHSCSPEDADDHR